MDLAPSTVDGVVFSRQVGWSPAGTFNAWSGFFGRDLASVHSWGDSRSTSLLAAAASLAEESVGNGIESGNN